MKKYDNYKDSGIGWLGEIPSHWDVNNFQILAKDDKYSFTGGPFGSDLKFNDYTEVGVRIIQLQNIGDGLFNDSYKIFTSNEKADQLISCNIYPNEIIIAKMADPVARACFIPNFDSRFLMASDGIRLAVNEIRFNSKFVLYGINSNYFRTQAEMNSSGSTRLRIGLNTLKKLKFILPTLEEQNAIANYLDHKTTQIDTLISKKQQFISLLQEERIAVINQAVTKGLDPKVKMKDSGIEWLGEIPEYWELWKISHSFNRIGSGTTPESGNPTYHENGTINWLNTGDLNDGEVLCCSKKITEKATKDYTSLKLFPAGSLVMAMYGATIGKTGIIKFDTTTNQACCVFCEGDIIDLKFLQYWFLAKKENIISLAIGGGQPNISQNILKDIRVNCPSMSEQIEIVQFLEIKTSDIDLVISKTQQEIELLKEYKTALISEVVTGKVDVREEVLN